MKSNRRSDVLCNEVPRVVIIGGGATGTGIARTAAEQGYDVVLVDRGELGSGTSSNFHGILHSGARYAVNDSAVAAECYKENQLLRSIIPSAVTASGGLFVALTDAEVAHSHILMKACEAAGIPVAKLTTEQVLHIEPELTRSVKTAFTVPDGFIDGVELLRLNRLAAVEATVPATFLTNHIVESFEKSVTTITAVMVRDMRSKAVERIACDFIVNASGVWAGEIAAMAGIGLNMIYDKGTMLVYDRQFTKAVLNRCRPEDDGDILAPHDGRSIMGTTSRVVTDLDGNMPTREEIEVLKREGAAMVPRLADTEILFEYAGVRPLLNDASAAGRKVAGSTRSISRSFKVLDHAEQGIDNLITIVGGKVTLYRRMAAAVVELLHQKNGR